MAAGLPQRLVQVAVVGNAPITVTPRGLQREVAARYIGISPTKFDQLVVDGRMPQPRRLDGRKLWDRLELDEAFSALPTDQEENPWDAMTA